jgi:hypothetical protein
VFITTSCTLSVESFLSSLRSIFLHGFDREETESVLDDFHQVENPRVMDDAYFGIGKEKYAELQDE